MLNALHILDSEVSENMFINSFTKDSLCYVHSTNNYVKIRIGNNIIVDVRYSFLSRLRKMWFRKPKDTNKQPVRQPLSSDNSYRMRLSCNKLMYGLPVNCFYRYWPPQQTEPGCSFILISYLHKSLSLHPTCIALCHFVISKGTQSVILTTCWYSIMRDMIRAVRRVVKVEVKMTSPRIGYDFYRGRQETFNCIPIALYCWRILF